MERETLEEAAKRWVYNKPESNYHAFVAGAQWQAEKMYSEEEVKEFMRIYARSEGWTVNEIFEQFKKK